MLAANRFNLEETPHSRQLRTGFPWLTFSPDLESEFRQANLDENLKHIRANLCLGIVTTLAFIGIEAAVLPAVVNRVTGLIHVAGIVPIFLVTLAATFSAQRHRWFATTALAAGILLGLAVVAIHITASLRGISLLFPCVLLATIFVYFMGGLIFYQALTANVLVAIVYVMASLALQLPGRDFLYDALSLVAVNVFCASVVYMHEKISRMRFLEAGMLRELVARDGLTGIQNRRMFDQHIQKVWQQGQREGKRVGVLLVDIDCFKNYNDRYGHQAGDECLRAVAISLSQCARRPMDFVARYGGEEFAVVLYEASREYVAEVLTRIQRSIAELNIAHDASHVASRLTVSIGAAFNTPSGHRTPDGLVQLADEALYSAKEQGRNRVVLMESEYHALRTGRFEKRPAPRAV